MDQPATTVLIAAYQQETSLRLVLAALAAAPRTDFTVHIADDGSAPRMDETLAAEARRLPFPVTFHWQPDDGFRKAEILNEAAAAALTAPEPPALLVFLDGDCIPDRGLIEVYRRAYRPGEFLTGSYRFLDEERSRALTPERVARGEHEGPVGFRQERKILITHWKNRLHRGGKTVRPRIRGGNFAVAAELFRRVDGFDEVFGGHGKEDSDLRNRMRVAGALGISLWTRAHVAHLSRAVTPSGVRTDPPETLYAEGKRRIEARQGLSSHFGGAEG